MYIYSGSAILNFTVEAESEEEALDMVDRLNLSHYQLNYVDIEDREKLYPDFSDEINDERKI